MGRHRETQSQAAQLRILALVQAVIDVERGMGLMETLERDGFAVCSTSANLEDAHTSVIRIATSLGEITPGRTRRVEVLEPVDKRNARRHSLSAIFGTGQFPWHTDTAHLTEPVRFIVLAAIECSRATAPTIMTPWRRGISSLLSEDDIASALFLVNNGRSSFYAGMLPNDARYLRYDPGCMTPVNDAATRVSVQLAEWSPPDQHVFRWEPGVVLVIDNWNMLHRRGSTDSTTHRKLLRCYAR